MEYLSGGGTESVQPHVALLAYFDYHPVISLSHERRTRSSVSIPSLERLFC